MPAALALRLTGGKYNTDPAKSLGGETSVWPVDVSNLFPYVPILEATRGATLVRALDLLNLGDQGAHRVRAWLSPGDSVELGTSTVADVSVIPGIGAWDHGHQVAFAAHPKANPLEFSDLLVGSSRRLWFKRTIPAKSPKGVDAETLHLSYL